MPHVQLSSWYRPAALTVALTVALLVALLVAGGACRPGRDSAALLGEARHYRQQGEIKAAVIEITNALEQDADNRAARMLLGEVYIEQDDAAAAEKELRRALALGAPGADLLPLLGKAMLMQGHYRQVLGEIGAEAQQPALLALRANARLGLGEVGEARRLFDALLAGAPGNPDALLGLARIAVGAGRMAPAAALAARALAANPADIDCLRFQADLLRLQGRPDAALALHRAILARHPHRVQAHIDMANLYTDGGRFRQAHAELEEARTMSDNMLPVMYSQALLDFREAKPAAARDTLGQILRVLPDHFPSVLLMGAVQLALGLPQRAQQQLQTFLAAYPQHLYASRLMTQVQLRNNNASAALTLLGPLLLAHPDDIALLALAGEVNLHAARYGAAADYFEQAGKLDVRAARRRTAPALSQLGNGEAARAVDELERAAAPGAALGRSYDRQGTDSQVGSGAYQRATFPGVPDDDLHD